MTNFISSPGFDFSTGFQNTSLDCWKFCKAHTGSIKLLKPIQTLSWDGQGECGSEKKSRKQN